MAFFELLANEFNTSFITKPDNGKITGNAFFGTYQYTTVVGNKRLTGTFELKPGASNNIIIEL